MLYIIHKIVLMTRNVGQSSQIAATLGLYRLRCIFLFNIARSKRKLHTEFETLNLKLWKVVRQF